MRKVFLCCVMSLLLAVAAGAVEIPLKDGSTIEAESYKVVDSFVLIKLINGGQLAYAVADVDMEALMRAQQAAAAEEAEPEKEGKPSGSIMGAVSLEAASSSAVAITDQDVGHIRPARETAEDEDGEAGEAEAPSGGGSVAVRNLAMDNAEGTWVYKGEVHNGSAHDVTDVKVELTSRVGDQVIDTSSLPVASRLGPGESRPFEHRVSSVTRPQATVRTYWMQPAPKDQR